jgi:hypothetical protein
MRRWEERRQLDERAAFLKSALSEALRKKKKKHRQIGDGGRAADKQAGLVLVSTIRDVVKEMRTHVLPALHAKRLDLHQRRFVLARGEAELSRKMAENLSFQQQSRAMHNLVRCCFSFVHQFRFI